MHPSIFDIEKAKLEASPWPFQDILDKLVASGFASIDEYATYNWWGRLPTKHISYAFTPEGKEACFRNRYSTPMAWAEDIQNGTRHCVVCLRDCYRKKVWAHNGKMRCICMACGAKGHGLQDLR
jgi:hypothetical protein